MTRHLYWTLLIVVTAAAVAATHLRGQIAGEHHHHAHEHTLPQQLPGPIVSTHELMDLFNKPLYEFLRAEMHKDLGAETEWDTIVDRGLQTAEVMNLVAIRQLKEGQERVWLGQARQVQQAGLELAAAAKQQNAEQTRVAYQNVIRGCNDCHQTFAPDHAPQLRP